MTLPARTEQGELCRVPRVDAPRFQAGRDKRQRADCRAFPDIAARQDNRTAQGCAVDNLIVREE